MASTPPDDPGLSQLDVDGLPEESQPLPEENEENPLRENENPDDLGEAEEQAAEERKDGGYH
ncbi:hypothetical protein [Sphingomonas crocodyli]|uniref:Uncharacterized protein n=1 Tax=Sphingomonas crocodyli TaxID=1979270 RepID=A0A437LYI3_9SPHN|nr:hypothetical protein [Sphingomonas crocodyli]RVT90471.1 hypothetical protein EOD43_19665 [Sphingomonas crocodyli]